MVPGGGITHGTGQMRPPDRRGIQRRDVLERLSELFDSMIETPKDEAYHLVLGSTS